MLIASGSKAKLQQLSASIRFTAKGVSINRGKPIPPVKGNYYLAPKGVVTVGAFKYRGRFALLKSPQKRGEYLLILKLPLETYLGGVLEGEISHSWPLESMKVQAIAARTYAYWMINNSKGRPYHIKSTTSHQVFKGSEKVHPRFKKALALTKRTVLTHKGKPLQTFFTAACGGETERAHYVWVSDKKLPYFQNIRCRYCTTHPKYKWEAKLSTKTVQGRLKGRFPGLGSIRSIRIKKRSPSKRALVVEVVGSRGRTNVSGNAFRLALGAKTIASLRFNLKKRGRSYVFSGTGYGHGVGLCQWGAKTMAEKGYSYRRILAFYYKQARLQKL